MLGDKSTTLSYLQIKRAKKMILGMLCLDKVLDFFSCHAQFECLVNSSNFHWFTILHKHEFEKMLSNKKNDKTS